MLHHEKGVISFSFRETLMASVLSSDPPLQIFAEKRTAATGLKGHGRVGNVQPDYSLWTQTGRCPLAVECKHYKRSSTSNFGDALNDYAGAVRDATIVLVNYGPVHPAVRMAIDAERQSRCEALGAVHPEEPKSRTAFETIVRNVVGDPVAVVAAPGQPLAAMGAHPVLLIDVSGSMKPVVTSEATRSLVETLVRVNGIRSTAAADNRLLTEAGVSPTDIVAFASARGTGGTSLHRPVAELLQRFTAVIVLTDEDGARELRELSGARADQLSLGDTTLVLVTVPGSSSLRLPPQLRAESQPPTALVQVHHENSEGCASVRGTNVERLVLRLPCWVSGCGLRNRWPGPLTKEQVRGQGREALAGVDSC